MTQNIPFQAEQPVFGKVGNISELVHMSPEDRQKYNISIDSFRTNLSVMQNERAEGRAEGRVERTKEVARKMKSIGLSIQVICQATGLSEEEVASL